MFKSQIVEKDIQEVVKETNKELSLVEGKNVLITGASGMLASYLVYTFLYANKYLFKKPCKLFLIIRKKKNYFGTSKDLFYFHQDAIKTIKKKTDYHYIIHAASKAAPKFYTKNMVDTLNSNILGLYSLIDVCNKKTESFLYFSSGEIYGAPITEKPISEDYFGTFDHLNDRSCYAEAKRACETICINYFRERNLPVKIVRIFHTFGPGVNLQDGRVFSDFINQGLKRKNIEIRGDKKTKRSILYLKDAAIMFLKILFSKKNGEIYNVGSERNVASVEDIANIVCQEFNKRYRKRINVVFKKTRAKFYKSAVKFIRADMAKFKKDFDYEPKTDIKEAFARTIDFLLSEK